MVCKFYLFVGPAFTS